MSAEQLRTFREAVKVTRRSLKAKVGEVGNVRTLQRHCEAAFGVTDELYAEQEDACDVFLDRLYEAIYEWAGKPT